MKKSLLALAVLGAFAGAASAQTNVTVYGIVDAGIANETGGANGSVTKLATGVQSGNRLGFKGTEDLGGGLKANFQLENGFNLDEGTIRQGGALFGRQAWVGLSGNFGAVGLGRQYNPFFIVLDSIDPFGTGLTGATSNLMNPTSVRTNNSITYSTPDMGGFSASVLYGLGEQAGRRSAGRTIDASIGYKNGPVAVFLTHDNVETLPVAATGTTAAVPTRTSKLTLLGGTYDFGPAKMHLGYEMEKDAVAAGSDFRDILVGVSAPVGAGTVLASYIKKKDKSAAGNQGGRQLAVGYTYALSKRTNLYSSYGRIKNDAAATNFVGDASSGGTAPLAGNSSGALAVGIRHKF